MDKIRLQKHYHIRGMAAAIVFALASILLVSDSDIEAGISSPPPPEIPQYTTSQLNGAPAEILYLPIVFNGDRVDRLPTIFGVETRMSQSGGIGKFNQTNTYWVHGAWIHWSEVEPNEGDRDWGAIASEEQKLLNASVYSFEPIVLVRSTPAWAQRFPGISCGQILPDKLDEFAAFMGDLVTRYSQDPYNVKYWELWNEPDVAPSLVPPDSTHGCWGDLTDEFYGGRDYGEMLKVVYPAIKAADPEAQVLVGGLLLDCDPENESVSCDQKPSLYLKGILESTAGDSFDGVSFHSYDFYNNQLGAFGNANWQSFSISTGPVIKAKATYLETLLASYGYTDKFLINTEGAVICRTEWVGFTCEDEFETTKAYYLAQSYASAIAQDLEGNLWYRVLGWPGSFTALLEPDLDLLPAFKTYKFTASSLKDAVFNREITEFPDVMGYEFDRGDRLVWVLWSLDGNDQPITLLGTPLSVYEIATDGSPTSLSPSTSLNVTLAPLFVEWNSP